MPDRRIRELRQQLLDEAQRLVFEQLKAEDEAESERFSRRIRALQQAAATLGDAIDGESAEARTGAS